MDVMIALLGETNLSKTLDITRKRHKSKEEEEMLENERKKRDLSTEELKEVKLKTIKDMKKNEATASDFENFLNEFKKNGI
jgi:hypothetical protein